MPTTEDNDLPQYFYTAKAVHEREGIPHIGRKTPKFLRDKDFKEKYGPSSFSIKMRQTCAPDGDRSFEFASDWWNQEDASQLVLASTPTRPVLLTTESSTQVFHDAIVVETAAIAGPVAFSLLNPQTQEHVFDAVRAAMVLLEELVKQATSEPGSKFMPSETDGRSALTAAHLFICLVDEAKRETRSPVA